MKLLAKPASRLKRGLLHRMLATPGRRKTLFKAAAYGWHHQRGSLHPGGVPDLGGDIFTAWTGPAVGFLHIEKCGGIAVMRWLSRMFHPLQINPDDHRDLPPHLCYRTPAFQGIDHARFPLVWGHYDAPTLRRLAPRHLLFTLLREPRARLLSLYHYWRSVDPARIDPDLAFSVSLAHRLSLGEFLACDDPLLTDLTDNVFTRRLTGFYATGAARDMVRDAPREALQAAIAALDGLGFVGITEHLYDSLTGLAPRLRVPAPDAAWRGNITAENHLDPSALFRPVCRAPATAEVAAALDRRTALDRLLYDHAFARFTSRQPSG